MIVYLLTHSFHDAFCKAANANLFISFFVLLKEDTILSIDVFFFSEDFYSSFTRSSSHFARGDSFKL